MRIEVLVRTGLYTSTQLFLTISHFHCHTQNVGSTPHKPLPTFSSANCVLCFAWRSPKGETLQTILVLFEEVRAAKKLFINWYTGLIHFPTQATNIFSFPLPTNGREISKIKIRATSISTLEEAQSHSQSSPSSFLASQVEKSCPATCWVEESGPPSLTGPVCQLEESGPPSLSFPTIVRWRIFFSSLS